MFDHFLTVGFNPESRLCVIIKLRFSLVYIKKAAKGQGISEIVLTHGEIKGFAFGEIETLRFR